MPDIKKNITFFTIFLLVSCSYFAQNWDTRTVIQFHNHNISKKTVYVYSQSIYPMVVAAPATGLIYGYINKNEKLFNTAIETTAALGFTYIGTQALKYSFKKERPFHNISSIQAYYEPDGYSFPSGHTSMAFSWATSVSLNYPEWYYIIPSYLYAIGVGYSRINLGVHYPSDVIIGGLLGIGSGILTHYTFRWLNQRKLFPSFRRFNATDQLSSSVPPSYEMILK